jgi:hypothetical protein
MGFMREAVSLVTFIIHEKSGRKGLQNSNSAPAGNGGRKFPSPLFALGACVLYLASYSQLAKVSSSPISVVNSLTPVGLSVGPSITSKITSRIVPNLLKLARPTVVRTTREHSILLLTAA